MTKEELIKLSRENLRKSKQGSLCECYDEAFIKGYELSEKQIATLEKSCDETQELLDKQIEATYKLDKENAELKARLNAINLLTPELEKQSKAKKKQLTKAKEILREYIRINLLPPIERNFDDEVKLFKQAEQFLKDIKEG